MHIIYVFIKPILLIENPTILEKMIVNSIGPTKAFGCGLLSLARV